MKHRWLGPYKIHKQLNKGVYKLENHAGVVLKVAVNQCRLKLYLSDKMVWLCSVINFIVTIIYSL